MAEGHGRLGKKKKKPDALGRAFKEGEWKRPYRQPLGEYEKRNPEAVEWGRVVATPRHKAEQKRALAAINKKAASREQRKLRAAALSRAVKEKAEKKRKKRGKK